MADAAKSSSNSNISISYTQFACIGSGFSGVALGATLKRWHGITDVRFFERHAKLGGTWFANKYPGCACDVPSILYSLSFAQNPTWSQSLAPHDELCKYLVHVAEEYGLLPKMTFNATVERCEWMEKTQRWRLRIRDGESGDVYMHECQFLFSGVGQLIYPRKPGIPGIETFKGPVFHASAWRSDVDLQDKKVIVVGNGCTATQIVPAIQHKTRHLTQFARSKHWITPPVILPNNKLIQFLYKHLSGVQAIARFAAFLITENDMRGFYMTRLGAAYRRHRSADTAAYMRKKAPEKYHDMLIPDFAFGCKRRIFDSGYLTGLHADNVTLTNDPIVEATPDGLRSKNGFTEADVIVMANGYETNLYLENVEVVGRDGETLAQHWAEMGGPGAYNTTSVSGFPNFFMILGPNSTTGHTSTLMAVENSVNFALRIIRPILHGETTTVDVKRSAEEQYHEDLQRDLRKTVWFAGCNSWYNRTDKNGKTEHNSMTYPHSQPHFWYKCLFPNYSDFTYTPAINRPRTSVLGRILKTILWTGLFISAGGLLAAVRSQGWEFGKYVPFLKQHLDVLRQRISL